MSNWPSTYSLIGTSFIADIGLPGETAGVINLSRDPRKTKRLPDCFTGEVKEVGSACKLVKVGDKVVITRWQYSQSDLDETRICAKEIDLVVVNDKCVNGYAAVKLYEPFKKTDDLIRLDKQEAPKSYFGQIVDIDNSYRHRCPTCHKSQETSDTKELKEGDIIFFQAFDYQYRIGEHTLVLKNIYDIVLCVVTEAA